MVDPQVEQYIKKQSVERQEVLAGLRQLIKETFPSIKEEMKWGVPVYDGGKFYIAALKKQVNLGFSIVGLSKDEVSLFEGQGKTMRHIKVASLEQLDKKRIIKLLRLVKKKAQCVQCGG